MRAQSPTCFELTLTCFELISPWRCSLPVCSFSSFHWALGPSAWEERSLFLSSCSSSRPVLCFREGEEEKTRASFFFLNSRFAFRINETKRLFPLSAITEGGPARA